MEDSFILNYDTIPPFKVSHSGGGHLRITAEEIILDVSARLIAEADEERSDIIEISKSIVDSLGHRHSFSTTISAYELWDAISTSESSYLEGAFIRSWQFPKGCEQASVVSGLNISADSRSERVFGIYNEHSQPKSLFSMKEKRFSARSDLRFLRNPQNGFASRIIAAINVFSPMVDSSGELELTPEHQIIVPIRPSLVVFDNYWRLSSPCEDSPLYWRRSDVPEPIQATLDEKGHKPQTGVDWIRD